MPTTDRTIARRSGVLLLALMAGVGCWPQRSSVSSVAFIPQAAEGMLWEVERLGATAAAEKLGYQISWNAPTSDSDVTGQVSLIDRVSGSGHQGLVLAPNHPLAPLEPVRRVLRAGIPVVVVSTELDLPPDGKLGYIVNDDEKMGELAAAEIARLLEGKGSVALVGLSRGAAGVKRRARGAERLLAREFPNIRVVSRQSGAFSASGAQENTTELLADHPDLQAVLSLTANATRGVHVALRSRALRRDIFIVGCEQDTDLLNYVGTGEVSAVVAANTYRMAYEAVAAISAFQSGKPIPPLSLAPPMLITKQTLESVEARPFIRPPR